MNIELIKPTMQHKELLVDMLTEWKNDIIQNNTNSSPWKIFANDFHDYENYIKNLDTKEDNNDGWVPDSTLFCLDKDRNIFVGAVNIRHYLNEHLLRTGGHIGDGIRPSERGKGYATAMIALALEECKKLGIKDVLMCCAKDNIASAKSIIHNGGVLENEVDDEGHIEQRYWIHLGFDFTTLKNNLLEKGYKVSVFETKEEATDYLNEQIHEKTVGFGGSATLTEMKLFDALSTHNTVYWHDKKPEHMTVMETRKAASNAEIYISSVNGISEQGEIINIDNTGNRVAAISFGPSKVYLVLGSNKVAKDFETAMFRARNVAAPLNAKRLNRKTPCAVHADRCYDCKSPERICRTLSVLWDKPTAAEYEIILIDEKLGF